MPFKRFVETGRIALISDGQHKGKLAAIVDVINQTRALIDGPETGVPRHDIRLNQLHLTKFRIKFPFTAGTRVVRKAWKDSKVNEQWSQSMWARKVEAKKKRLELTDFDRFKLNHARSIRNKLRTTAYLHLKRLSRKKKAAGKDDAKKGAKPAKKAAAPKKAK
ncbi:ribosomal protein L14 [Nesidiocoris tenuis]|uniref:Large ribosomal subunit protein eL14 n=1 Tax=Nesidiocoris tenuis TaxID=355587 RepID=A0ABN7B709_9HEMI|nr:ribosomal protein L14 [Nesidiocoris tenuis]